MTDLNHLMQQARKMQEQLQKVQEEQAKQLVTGESGAGLVKVTMNGHHDVKKVELDPSLMSEEREVVEDLIAAAINATVRKIADNNKSSMAGMAAGMGLPPGFKMPF
ncbi:MAG TPA: YbaB/EbfC family nucleoid-associated protein [Pseudomonadales bacterium]